MTQEALAEALRLSPRQLQRIEGGLSDVRLTMLDRIADALDLKPCDLLAPPGRTVARRPGRPKTRRTSE